VELVAHTDGRIDENIILNYLKAYQSHRTLYDREIWALPMMMRLALIENIRNICEKIKDTRYQWSKADEITDSWLDNEGADAGKVIKSVESNFKAMEEIHPSFIEHLSYRLRRARRGYTQILKYIDENLDKYGMSIVDINQKEHNSQSVSAVSMGNCIISLKFVPTFDWVDIFESTSFTEQILRQDPDGTYPRMDFASRSNYRRKVEELADLYGVSELHVAREAVQLAKNTCNKERGCHIGHCLIGNDTESLEKRLGQKIKPLGKVQGIINKHPITLYLGSVILITLAFAAYAADYSFHASYERRLLLSIVAGLAVIIPSSEIAVGLVNWVICNLKKPAVFPKLELKEGIPESLRTMVVIPALLPDEKRVIELLENLERHYLANKEENLYFALLGDFKDSFDAKSPEDKKIIDAGLNGIKELNLRYAGKDHDKFYYFHRERKYNKSHEKWMGWERKRGALLEFNELMLGSGNTSFKYSSGTIPAALEIKYVITLDADTVLPIGMAKKMIGTMAHPLHRPVVDKSKGIVTEGYGLIQPRISFDVESTNKSLFSRIFTGQEGLDPYVGAVSDIYQDLFCEGIFTGKGIYDLKVFQSVLKNAIPENSVLSHDLLEGSYVRVGLATDLELVDSYPPRYNSYTARLHRWVRGDWQLIPWLCNRIHDRSGNLVKNPLSLISRWKIFDNLRRSLVSPAIMLLTNENLNELRIIARKTWRYFEEFANFKNHYLVPDNYQEDPPRGVAHRTSPTNIGLGLLASLSARDLGYIGIHEMTDIISRTVSTIEKMEKWNGHLYNWYDTRTLQPLRPRYISTVDSGNFVCYLETLSQGLKEYMNSPLVDARLAAGIKDTFTLMGKDGIEMLEKVNYINEIEGQRPVDITLWSRTLNELLEGLRSLNLKKSPWKAKAEHMIEMFKKELAEFMLRVDLLDSVPQELLNGSSAKTVQEGMESILKALKGNPCLKDLPDVWRNVQRDIDKVSKIIKGNKERDSYNILNWLDQLRDELSKSTENTEKFISRYKELIARIKSLSEATEFLPLYVEKKQLFSIGYNIEENRLTNSFYDLLASEARQTSYIAIARGEIPPVHWFKLGRALTVIDNYKGLVSWTGTMFEYLMPLLIMKSYKNTLLDETYSFVIRSQKKYGYQRGIPWGASESGFYSMDINLDYQYKAIGVPWLGLKRGLAEDAVVAPYATFLALLADPEGAMDNIRVLKSEGLDGPYGFYEAIEKGCLSG